jgi:hypothetical protein
MCKTNKATSIGRGVAPATLAAAVKQALASCAK